jgi:uncharacterized protein YndB with AHSA1/START domain
MKNETTIKIEPGKHDITIIREFEAPRELVFKAFANPDILMQFLGPNDTIMKIDYYYFKTGGSYRYFHSKKNGIEYAFNGAIHEVCEPLRIIQTFEFEAMPERGHVSLDTLQFEELPNNRTKLVIHSAYRFASDRDAMMQGGAKKGIIEGFEKLDQLLIKEF